MPLPTYLSPPSNNLRTSTCLVPSRSLDFPRPSKQSLASTSGVCHFVFFSVADLVCFRTAFFHPTNPFWSERPRCPIFPYIGIQSCELSILNTSRYRCPPLSDGLLLCLPQKDSSSIATYEMLPSSELVPPSSHAAHWWPSGPFFPFFLFYSVKNAAAFGPSISTR